MLHGSGINPLPDSSFFLSDVCIKTSVIKLPGTCGTIHRFIFPFILSPGVATDAVDIVVT